MTSGEGSPRVRPGGWREVGPAISALARVAGRVSGTEPPAVFLTLGRHRRLFWGWLHFAGRLMPGGRLSRRETELVILRVASRSASAYELSQHRRLGARAGLGRAEIQRVEAGERFEGRDGVLLDAVDELLEREDLADDSWARLRDEYDEREAIELVMLVGHYRMLATALRTLRVQPDRPR